jgi:hypothetical protein
VDASVGETTAAAPASPARFSSSRREMKTVIEASPRSA